MTVSISEWTAALRSGEYAQGEGELITQDDEGNRSYCCLGLYEKLRADQGLAEIHYRPGRNRCEVISSDTFLDSAEFALTASAQKELGVDDSNPDIEFDAIFGLDVEQLVDDNRDDFRPMTESLASLNDHGLTFNQMADVIDYFFGGEK